MALTLAFLPSPLLGPSVWAPVAEVLADRGWSTLTCAPPTGPRTGEDVLEVFLTTLPLEQHLVLVPHSNAGAYVPALTKLRSVVAVVFVDAVLPPPRGRIPLAPLAFLDFLRQKADGDGLLPLWTDWWPEDEVAALFPDRETQARVEREQPRLPVSYFEGFLPVPEGWDDGPAAYLAFGETYRDEREDARRRGWPVSTVAGGHLQLLNDPEQVATELVGLFARTGLNGPS